MSLLNSDIRLEKLTNWLKSITPQPIQQIIAIVNDASFRRYFRIVTESCNYIAMDAPPDKEDCQPFVAINKKLAEYHIQVPAIIAEDLANGFLLLSDFGDIQLLQKLDSTNADHYYQKALLILADLQLCQTEPEYALPVFTGNFGRLRFQLFHDWYLIAYKKLHLLPNEIALLKEVEDLLINNILAQPFVFTHRDFHSRNLMILNDDSLGVLDYQDAIFAPITYDLVSLLKDCYIAFPKKEVRTWVKDFYVLIQNRLPATISLDQFIKWFDLMGLHRHLRILGTFARLHIRDGKDRYLNDMPLIIDYVLDVCNDYEELIEFKNFFNQRILLQAEMIAV